MPGSRSLVRLKKGITECQRRVAITFEHVTNTHSHANTQIKPAEYTSEMNPSVI